MNITADTSKGITHQIELNVKVGEAVSADTVIEDSEALGIALYFATQSDSEFDALVQFGWCEATGLRMEIDELLGTLDFLGDGATEKFYLTALLNWLGFKERD
jgi:hypothetical protein